MADDAKVSQFQNPRGLGGRFAGWTMTWWNAGINAFVSEIVDAGPRDHILEIGFGPGTLLRRLSRNTEQGFIAGVDPSAAMQAQARRRNRHAIERGRMELKSSDIQRIPYPDARFDKVCTVNTIYFWSDPQAAAREVFRVTRGGGRFVLAFRAEEQTPQSFSARRGLHGYAPERARELLEAAGFTDLRMEIRPVRLMTAACVIATR
ncbi:MAG TPA: class I SAM-dependent methyltransferase [Candidatus Binataceae bacterium]|nr:class I SAM-dependent methyltransferase [Candidatus Binataceae bacterium]